MGELQLSQALRPLCTPDLTRALHRALTTPPEPELTWSPPNICWPAMQSWIYLIYAQSKLGINRVLGRGIPPPPPGHICCAWHLLRGPCCRCRLNVQCAINPVTCLHCFLFVDSLSIGLPMNSFNCLIPSAAARCLECVCGVCWIVRVWIVVHAGGVRPSLNCGHKQAYCSSLRWYTSMEMHGGMIWQGRTKNLRDKLVPLPFCPPQIPHGVIQAQTKASMVRGWWLTAWPMAWPGCGLDLVSYFWTSSFLSCFGNYLHFNWEKVYM
jgi:hypothetical protein